MNESFSPVLGTGSIDSLKKSAVQGTSRINQRTTVMIQPVDSLYQHCFSITDPFLHFVLKLKTLQSMQICELNILSRFHSYRGVNYKCDNRLQGGNF